jgi:hypothetical protein
MLYTWIKGMWENLIREGGGGTGKFQRLKLGATLERNLKDKWEFAEWMKARWTFKNTVYIHIEKSVGSECRVSGEGQT